MDHRHIIGETLRGGDRLVIDYRIIRMIGDLPAGIVLSQLLCWEQPIAISDEEFSKRLCLSRYAIREARKKLSNLGILETTVAMSNGAPTTHYRLSLDVLANLWTEYLEKEIATRERQEETAQTEREHEIEMVKAIFKKLYGA